MIWLRRSWKFQLPGGVVIKVRLPRWWRREREVSAPLAFRNGRDESLFQITPFPREASPLFHGKLRNAVAATAKDRMRESVDNRTELFGISGANVEGWYYIASDRNVKPGEWGHMISGMIEINGIVMSFTVLSHTLPRMGEGDALRSLEYMVVKNP